MKKKWKIFWIVCAITGGIGMCCLFISLGMGVTLEKIENELPNGISIGKFESEDTREVIVPPDLEDFYQEIKKLDLDLTAGELQILESEDSDIYVETEGINEKLDLQYYAKGDALVLTTEKSLAGVVNQSIGTIYIYLPKDYQLEEAEISVHAGVLYIEDIHVKELSVEVGAGEADIDDFEVREAEFDCGAGEITAFGLADKKIDIDCGMGNVSLAISDDEQNYNYDLTCGVGEIVCGSNSYSGIGGDQKVDNQASKEMNIDCGIGGVIVEFEGHHDENHEREHF